MKKIFAALLALCLLATAALAEDILTYDNEPIYEGEYIAIAGTNLCFYLPIDWQIGEAPEGVDGEVYTSGDGLTVLTVVTGEGSLDDLQAQCADLVAQGTLLNSGLRNINDVTWLASVTADQRQAYVQTQIDDATVLTFAFVWAEPTGDTAIEEQMVGSLALLEEE